MMNALSDRPEVTAGSSVLALTQQAFAACIRHPDAPPPVGVPAERMAVYRELFFNNVFGALSDAFPQLQSQLGEEGWLALVQAFFAHHRCRTPYFVRLPGELIAFLEAPGDYPPWLAELARYEWMELELTMAEDGPEETMRAPQELLTSVPRLSPLSRLANFTYPVHRTTADFRPDTPQSVHLLAWRDRQEEVRWLELQPMAARLLDLIDQGAGEAGESLLRRIAAEFGFADVEAAVAGGRATLEGLWERGVLRMRD